MWQTFVRCEERPDMKPRCSELRPLVYMNLTIFLVTILVELGTVISYLTTLGYQPISHAW